MSDSASSIVSHIDHPLDWDGVPELLSVRGWAFQRDRKSLRRIRVAIDGQFLPGTVGHHRPDVSAAFRDAPNDYCGYQVAFRIPRGTSDIRIEAQFESASDWCCLLEKTAKRPFWQRPPFLGGGNPADLLAGQLALVPEHTPRALRPERFPPTGNSIKLPRLAVVIPSLNQATWLGHAIDSVVASRSEGVELHVWDGGSDDGSADLLTARSEELTSWRSEADGGQAYAVKHGLDATVGDDDDIMAWLNADDFYLPGAVDFVRGYFATHPDVDVVYANRVLVNEQGHEIGRWHLPPHDPEVLKLYDFVPQETLFWRRRIWSRVGGVDSDFKFALDWDLLLRMQEAGARMVHLPRFVGAFRLHQQQKSQAAIGETGQSEIDRLRERTFGRNLTPEEMINSTSLIRYLRNSSKERFLASWGWRRPIA